MHTHQVESGGAAGTSPLPSDATSRTLVTRNETELPDHTTAFRELVRTYTPLVYRRAFRLLGSSADAEEIVQEVFLRAFRSIGHFEPRRPVSHWLRRITTRACSNRLRSRDRDARRRDALAASLDRARGMELESEQVGHVEPLDRFVERLDARTRRALRLRFAEEYSYPEIAAELGVGESAAKMRVRRGVDRLRELMSAPRAEGGEPTRPRSVAGAAAHPRGHRHV